ncbi:MAG: nitroreductase family protein [Myxococcota bacterium]
MPLNFKRHPAADIREAAATWKRRLQTRRSVRHFSSEPIPIRAVEDIIHAAASAPSGAHKQPWTFVLVTEPALKAKIREAAEEEERAFYGGRAGERWLKDLEAFETDWQKPFLEEAPALIAVFAQRHGEGREDRHYYVNESVGIAVGFLLAGLHHAGLATLTHTPSPMKFLAEVLGRPASERAYLLIPVGFPTDDCQVPDLERKPLDEVLVRR